MSYLKLDYEYTCPRFDEAIDWTHDELTEALDEFLQEIANAIIYRPEDEPNDELLDNIDTDKIRDEIHNRHCENIRDKIEECRQSNVDMRDKAEEQLTEINEQLQEMQDFEQQVETLEKEKAQIESERDALEEEVEDLKSELAMYKVEHYNQQIGG